jgi:two-component system, OmpR family, KDP operon response regulator KdpE
MSTSSGKILIVDDDPELRRALHTTLHNLGFEVMESPNGEQALKNARNHKFDVVLLDINMPGMGGIEACRELRRSALGFQILMLTAQETEEDKIKALDAGADDYVNKPFSVPELTARIRAAIRRATTPATEAPDTLVVGDIELDPVRRTVRKAGDLVRLTPKEFELLHYLMAHAGLPVTHARLLHTVWGTSYSQQREYLRIFIDEVRKKLEDDPASPQYLLTEAYVGYRFKEPKEAGAEH